MQKFNSIDFHEIMYGFNIEDAIEPSSLKVIIPEAMPDIVMGVPNNVIRSVSPSIFVNANRPVISGNITMPNYIIYSILTPSLYINKKVKKGAKVLLSFVDSNPYNGYIIGVDNGGVETIG